MATAKKAALKIPKSLAAAADLFYQKREQRLALQKEVDALEAEEKEIKEHLIRNLPKSDATGVSGKLCRVTAVAKVVAQVEDWDTFYAHVAKNRAKGGFALLNRAVNQKAVAEIWDAGKAVPGVKAFSTTTLSVNKV